MTSEGIKTLLLLLDRSANEFQRGVQLNLHTLGVCCKPSSRPTSTPLCRSRYALRETNSANQTDQAPNETRTTPVQSGAFYTVKQEGYDNSCFIFSKVSLSILPLA